MLSDDAVVIIATEHAAHIPNLAELWEGLVDGRICVLVQNSDGRDYFSLTTFRLRRAMEGKRFVASRVELLGHSIISPAHDPVEEDKFIDDERSGLAVILKFDVLRMPGQAQIEVDVATFETEFPADKTRVFAILSAVFAVVQAAATTSLTNGNPATSDAVPSAGGKS